MTNSQYAFKLNMETLVENIPLRDKRTLFFWTFTAPEVISTMEFKKRWKHFITLLSRYLPAIPWIRVFELHPGLDEDFNGHGLHIHAVTNRLVDVNLVREIANQANLGRIHAKRIPHAKASNYLAKYLNKTKRSNAPCLKGMRLWSTLNWGNLNKTLTKNIVRYTFRSWLSKNLHRNNSLIEQVLKNNNSMLYHKIRVEVASFWGFRRFRRIGTFIDENFYQLAKELSRYFNDHLSCSGLQPNFIVH